MSDDDAMLTWASVPNTGDMRIDIPEFARLIESQALERAIRVTADSKTTSHACDAIRALMQDAQSKEGS